MRYILDLETIGLPDAKEFAEPVSAPSNYKDEAKIAAYIAEKQAEQIARASLDLDLCQIVAIGLMPEGSSTVEVNLARTPDEEAEMLTVVWDALLKIQHPVIIGFNSLGFDLPVLMRRSQYLGVSYPKLLLDKYRTPHIDLMQHLTWNGLVKARGLKFYCKRFGIPVHDEVAGVEIPALVAAGEWNKVIAHCESDVRLTAALASRLGLFSVQPELVPAA